MQFVTASTTFGVMPKREQSDTTQLGVRVKKSVKEALIAFSVDHPLQPPLANIIERAVMEYIERERPNLPKSLPAPARRPDRRG